MELGESPVWDERTGTLLFVDIVRGAIALRRDGGLRFNDGACDPQGRFWVGTMALDFAPGRGTLCVTGRAPNCFSG